jgi:hypothetical protein
MQRYGFDNSVIYFRKLKEEYVENNPFNARLETSIGYNGFRLYFIGFCGRVYPCIKYFSHNTYKLKIKEIFCYNIDSINKTVDKYMDHNEKEQYYTPTERRRLTSFYGTFGRFRKPVCIHDIIQSIFDTLPNPALDYSDIFTKNKCCSFVFMPGSWRSFYLYNPRLANVEFYRVKNCNMAFQEIETYLGSQAAPEKPIPQISDNIMAEAKGFDRFSFRKDRNK